jgi:hypothetical protein
MQKQHGFQYSVWDSPHLWHTFSRSLQHFLEVRPSTVREPTVRYRRLVSEISKLPSILPRPCAAQWTRSSSVGFHQHTTPLPEATQSRSLGFLLISTLCGARNSSPPPTESLRPRPKRRTRTGCLSSTIHTKISGHGARYTSGTPRVLRR